MSLTEFNQEEYDRNRREEGFEEGIAQGISQGAYQKALETARRLILKGLNMSDIADVTQLSLDEVNALQEEFALSS